MAAFTYTPQDMESRDGDNSHSNPLVVVDSPKIFKTLAVLPISARVYLNVYENEKGETFLTLKRYGKTSPGTSNEWFTLTASRYKELLTVSHDMEEALQKVEETKFHLGKLYNISFFFYSK